MEYICVEYLLLCTKLQGPLCRRLITHFDVCYRLGRITWPRRMPNKTIIRIPITEPIVEFNAVRRALAITRDFLFVADSKLRIEDNQPGLYVKSIGKGLFTRQPIKGGETIAEYMGEWIERKDMLLRQAQGIGDYIIGLNSNLFLDCHNYRHLFL